MRRTCTRVTLRQRPITNGRISLYLDYYPAVRHPKTFKSTRREFLGIYIYAHPKNEMERDFNEDMLNKAEFIRCRRTQALINEELDIFDQYQLGEDFLAFYKEVCRTKTDRWDIVFVTLPPSAVGVVPLARLRWTSATSFVTTCSTKL